MPGVSIWTDLIAGFPGEEDTDHNATVTMMRELALSHLHVFPYSPRPGTPAVHLADNVPPNVKKERAAQLQELGRDLANAYNRTQVGKELMVLVERVIEGEAAIGSPRVTPIITCRLEFPGGFFHRTAQK